MILCLGEILLDTFSSDKKEKSFVGGAPFNVYYTLNRLSSPSFFIGNIGKDEQGKQILSFCEKNQLSSLLLHEREGRTTISYVKRKGKEETYTFLDGVDTLFEESDLNEISKCDILHLGSLLLRNEKGYSFALKAIERAKQLHKVISFDLNYRKALFQEKEVLARYKKILSLCDIVKFSKEELLFYTQKKDIDSALASLSIPLVIVTLAEKGSLAYVKGKKIEARSIKIEPLSSVGAGDCFYATLLSQIDSFSFHDILFLPSLLKTSLRFANVVAALKMRKVGALSGIPTYQEAEKCLQSIQYQGE